MKKTFSSQKLLKTAKWSGVYPIGLHGFELIFWSRKMLEQSAIRYNGYGDTIWLDKIYLFLTVFKSVKVHLNVNCRSVLWLAERAE